MAWAIERPGTLNWYVTQNYKSAKQIAWRQLKIMVPPEMFVKKNESELSVELTNGSVIQLKGAENADALRGVSLSSLIVDEAAYVKQEAWEMVLRPALSDQGGPAWFITTPAGLNWFHDLWEAAEDQPDWSQRIAIQLSRAVTSLLRKLKLRNAPLMIGRSDRNISPASKR